MDKILTVNDVAAILQVKPITVREMFREKRLRAFKVGKSWRTTESMLKDDIDSLTRGEKPKQLPNPVTAASPRKKTVAKPAKEKAAKKRAIQPPPAKKGKHGSDQEQMLF